jgi:EAL and modified HD-GYP domain-containing signal transduction protein
MDMREVSEPIKEETSLSYRLLRFLNSPAFLLVAELPSIPQALSLIGESGVRKWVSLVAVACMGDEKPQGLVTVPQVRARFCELIALLTCLVESPNDLFLAGLLSAIDVILNKKMTDVPKGITICQEIPEAFLRKKNTYQSVFDVALMYERSDWDKIGAGVAQLGIVENALPGLFLHAVDWAGGVIAGHPVEEIEAT